MCGVLIAWIDSSPGWDDTGISAFLIFLAGGVISFFAGQKPLLIALATGIWIPVAAVLLTHNYTAFMALVPALLGALTGYYAGKKFVKSP